MNRSTLPPFHGDLPFIWVDTNAIIEMALARKGEQPNEQKRDRALQLYECLQKAVISKKILYLNAHQKSEYITHEKCAEECERIQQMLSYGIETFLPSQIIDNQRFKMMSVYLGIRPSFILEQSDILPTDPLSTMSRVDKLGFIVKSTERYDDKRRQNMLSNRDHYFHRLEATKQYVLSQGRTYQEQIEIEMGAEYLEIEKALDKFYSADINNQQLSPEEESNLVQICRPLSLWFLIQLNGPNAHMVRDFIAKHKEGCNSKFILNSIVYILEETAGGMQEFRKFMYSDAYRSIPYIDIESSIYSHIITSGDHIKHSDMKDISHFSTMLPYSYAMITDAAMKNTLIAKKLDKKYQTTVYGLKDVDSFIDLINKI